MTLARTDLETRLALLSWLSKHIDQQRRALHDELAATMRRGMKLPVLLGDDRQLANASMSNPAPELMITDARLLADWYRENYPDHTEEVHAVSGPLDEVIAILREYAPHLLRSEVRIRDWAMTELRAASVDAGCVHGPGGEMDLPGVRYQRPQPRLTVTLAKDADDVMANLVGRLTIDGHLKEIET